MQKKKSIWILTSLTNICLDKIYQDFATYSLQKKTLQPHNFFCLSLYLYKYWTTQQNKDWFLRDDATTFTQLESGNLAGSEGVYSHIHGRLWYSLTPFDVCYYEVCL